MSTVTIISIDEKKQQKTSYENLHTKYKLSVDLKYCITTTPLNMTILLNIVMNKFEYDSRL